MDAVIDMPVLLERVEDDHELLRELARLFLHDAPLRLNAIRKALDFTNARVLHETAHALKGSAGNLAATAVFDAAKELERIGRTGDWVHAEEAYALLQLELERLITALGELLLEDPA